MALVLSFPEIEHHERGIREMVTELTHYASNVYFIFILLQDIGGKAVIKHCSYNSTINEEDC